MLYFNFHATSVHNNLSTFWLKIRQLFKTFHEPIKEAQLIFYSSSEISDWLHFAACENVGELLSYTGNVIILICNMDTGVEIWGEGVMKGLQTFLNFSLVSFLRVV